MVNDKGMYHGGETIKQKGKTDSIAERDLSMSLTKYKSDYTAFRKAMIKIRPWIELIKTAQPCLFKDPCGRVNTDIVYALDDPHNIILGM